MISPGQLIATELIRLRVIAPSVASILEERQKIADVADEVLAGLRKAEHPEETCQLCGGPNITWFANNSLWNKVTGNKSGILCPICFVNMAENSYGMQPTAWKLIPEFHRKKADK